MGSSKELMGVIREAVEETRRTGDAFKMTEALSALDQLEAQQQPKRLTDAEVDRIVNGQFTREIAYAIQREAWSSALRYARDNGYFGGLSVDDAVKVAYDWFEGPVDNGPGSDYDKLRARLTAKAQGK
jgi:hypothetical protein